MLKRENHVKKLLKEGKNVIAAWVQAASPITAEIVARAGFDVVMIDLEHGPGDVMSTVAQVQAMQGADAMPFARAPWNDMVAIKRILDAGIYGLLVPYVNTAKEAVAAVRAAKYPPQGMRGIAGSPRAAGYGNNSMQYLVSANDEIFVMIAIETPEAAENLDRILEVEGLDGIFIGPMDLATSMGSFGNPKNDRVQEVIRAIERKVLAAGKVLGTVASTWEDAHEKYRKGYQFIVGFSDTTSLNQAAMQRVQDFSRNYPDR